MAKVVVGASSCSSFLVSEMLSSSGSLVFPGEALKVWLGFISSYLLSLALLPLTELNSFSTLARRDSVVGS